MINTIEIFSPEQHGDWAQDIVWDEDLEKMGGLTRDQLYSCGWSDSDNEDNDEALYSMTNVLFDKGDPKPPNMHPQSFDSGGVVTYKEHKFFCNAGPSLFASREALELLAKDSGVRVRDYDNKDRGCDFFNTHVKDVKCICCDRDAVIGIYENKEGDGIFSKCNTNYCFIHFSQMVAAAINAFDFLDHYETKGGDNSG